MKALMIATKPEWTRKIINGEKDLEFRNYEIPKGTRVLVYESLGKRHKGFIGYNGVKYDTEYEGRGKVVLEFTIGECYEMSKEFTHTYILEEKGKSMGYTNQNYAHIITDLIVYDDEWIIELADKVELSNDYFDKLVKAHIAPQPITNYVGWKKWQIIKDDKELYLSENPHLTHPPQGRVYIYLEDER
jgi:hypothetical protein